MVQHIVLFCVKTVKIPSYCKNKESKELLKAVGFFAFLSVVSDVCRMEATLWSVYRSSCEKKEV